MVFCATSPGIEQGDEPWISEEQKEKEMVSPWFFTGTRFFMIIANKTLKHKQSLLFRP